MKLRLALLLALCLSVAGLTVTGGGPAAAADVPTGATWDEIFFPSLDGTMLNGELLLPEQGCGDTGCPVIVSIGPYYGQGSQGFPVPDPLNAGPSGRFYDFIAHDYPGRGNIFQQGYAWLAVDSRGYGESGGCNDYGGVGEQMDAAAAVEWAGTQEWSSGKVGMWGKSYDAWTQVMALAMNPPHLEAVVIQSPIIERYGIAYVNGVHHDSGWYVTTGLYQGYDYTPTALPDATPEEVLYPTAGTLTDPTCWPYQHAMIAAGWDRDGLPSAEYWREGDLRPRASANDDVAVLWSHGFNDVNTKPDQIFGVYDGLVASPAGAVRGWFGEWAHDRGNQSELTGRTGFLEEALDWFDHYLRGLPFRYAVNAANVVEVQDNEGAWRTESTYPPADVRPVVVPLLDGSYADDGSAGDNGSWTFSQPVVDEFRITGESTLSLTADIQGAWGNLVAILYDYDPETGDAVEISRGAYRFEGDGPVSFRLHPRDHVMRAGHQLAFHMTGAHPEFLPHPSLTTVSISEASLSMPVPLHERTSNLAGDPANPSSGGPQTVSPTAAQVEAGAIEMPLPETIPFPDDATRESVSPTITDDPGQAHSEAFPPEVEE